LHDRLHDNLRRVRERIEAACARAGRPTGAVRLVAVTKSAPPEACVALAELGQVDLGESRAQALAVKARHCAERRLEVRWHFLGHLQRNKARDVVRTAGEIHSVDSLRLVEALERVAAEEGRRPRVFLEVDFTASAERTGADAGAIAELSAAAAAAPHLRLAGLMTMAPMPQGSDADVGAARGVFARLAELAAELPAERFERGRAELSMGMSSDFEAAIEEGADVVRVGSLLFEGIASSMSSRGGTP
jgi:pyridoxal phosphate enzyme (YggS family)